MTYNSLQVAEKLGVSRGVVLRMVRDGELATMNKPDPKKKKFFPKFDSKVINEYLAQHGKTNGRKRKTTAPNPSGILSQLQEMNKRLKRVEELMEKLYNAWL